MQHDEATKDIPLVSESMKKIAEDAEAATSQLKKRGALDLAPMLGLTEFDKHIPVEKERNKVLPTARFY